LGGSGAASEAGRAPLAGLPARTHLLARSRRIRRPIARRPLQKRAGNGPETTPATAPEMGRTALHRAGDSGLALRRAFD